MVTATIGTGRPFTPSVEPFSVIVNSAPSSRMSARLSRAPVGAVKTTSTQVPVAPTSTVPPEAPGPPRSTPGWVVVAVGSVPSKTSKLTSLPEESRKPIFNLP